MRYDKLLWTYTDQRESENLWHSKIKEIRTVLQAIEKELS
jgi:hypothetical protein